MRLRMILSGLVLVGVGACVDVPDAVRAQFAAAGPTDRSNYRPGPHGVAPIESDAGAASAGEAP